MDHHYFLPLGMLTVFSQASDFNKLLYSQIFDTLWKMYSCVSVFRLVYFGILTCVCNGGSSK